MEHQLFFYVALITNDHSIRVDRAKFMRTPPTESERVKYAAVFQLTRKQLVRLH